MSGFKQFFSGLVLCAFLFSSGGMAEAANPERFLDVPEGHAYYDAVDFAYEHGISNGISDDCFGLDSQISMNALCAFAVRTFMPDVVNGNKSAYDVLSGFSCIPDGIEKNARVDFATGLVVLCRAACVLPCGDYDYTCSEAFRYVRDVGFDMGILDIRDKTGAQLMTRGDAVYIAYKLSCWLGGDAARGLSHTGKYGFGYIKMSATDKYVQLLPQLYSSILRLPFETLKAFHDQGYQVLADNEHIDLYNRTHKNIKAIALFSRSSKTIWTVVGYSLPHEMGHFTQYVVMNDREGVKPYYKAEKDHLSSLVSVYAKQDSGEFFGEFFAVYMANQDNPVKLAKLKSDMPKTFDYFEKLKESNWMTEHSAQTLSASSVQYE